MTTYSELPLSQLSYLAKTGIAGFEPAASCLTGKRSTVGLYANELQEWDLNPRPSGNEPDELPTALPRYNATSPQGCL